MVVSDLPKLLPARLRLRVLRWLFDDRSSQYRVVDVMIFAWFAGDRNAPVEDVKRPVSSDFPFFCTDLCPNPSVVVDFEIADRDPDRVDVGTGCCSDAEPSSKLVIEGCCGINVGAKPVLFVAETVGRIKDFGAFVEILPGRDGLCHISELSCGYISSIDKVVNVGDAMKVLVIDVDEHDRVKLSRRKALEELGEEDPIAAAAETEASAAYPYTSTIVRWRLTIF